MPELEVTAHPADMYAQQEAITITPGGLTVDWKITPGPLITGVIWDQADLNHDGTITAAEALTWFKPASSQWHLALDDQPLTDIQLVKIHFPAKMDILEAGDEPIEIQFMATWPSVIHDSSKIVIHDAFHETTSLYWFSLKSQPGITFSEPLQKNGLLQTTLSILGNSPNPSNKNSEFTEWISGKPNLPGLTGAISSAATNVISSSQGAESVSTQANIITSLLSPLRTQAVTPTFLLGAFLLSIVLGSLHALTPGHGKALVAAYLVGSQGRTIDAVILGSVVTLTHTGSVLLLGLVTLIASRYILPSLLIPWLDVLSGIFIVAFGINLLISRGRSLLKWRQTSRVDPHVGKIAQIKLVPTGIEGGKILAHTHIGGVIHSQEQHQHDHSHAHPGHSHDHEHIHSLPANQVTWKSLLSLGISGGLVPCPDAIAILLVAVAVNRIPLGMLLIVAFSTGLALVLIGIGIAMVHGIRLINRNELVNRFSPFTPLVSAVAVLVLGLGLTWTALSGGFTQPTFQPRNLTGPLQTLTNIFSTTLSGWITSINHMTGRSQQVKAGQPVDITPQPTTNLNNARLMYIALDKQHENQLYVTQLSGGPPIAFTNESAGILGYNLSQDKKDILYSTLDSRGDSVIWGMANDGTQKHILLRCTPVKCGGAIWSPDKQSLVYERFDNNTTSALPIPTLWWLNLKTGETKPVFRDDSFPSYSPSFSIDGQWLSYITPSNNTLQVFNLHTGQNQSVPYWSGMPGMWSPTDISFLYWDKITRNDRIIYQIKRYIVSSGESIDLIGSPDHEDYSAAWSPDGQWIAIILSNLNSIVSNQEQVWLVRSDGSQAHPILNQEDVSYENLGWSPDNHTLAYQLFSRRDNQKVTDIWIVDLQTAKQTQIIAGGSQPIFLP